MTKCGHANKNCGCDNLTAAEALALPPDQVEANLVAPDGPRWVSLDEGWLQSQLTLGDLRKLRYRRVRAAPAPDHLPWSEAVALVIAGEAVETRCKGGDWGLVRPRDQLTIEQLTSWEFRRARPAKSRVEEMADGNGLHYRTGLVDGIRAACEWANRELDGGTWSVQQVANAIEREFLEPRR